jgi:hypothetical protein
MLFEQTVDLVVIQGILFQQLKQNLRIMDLYFLGACTDLYSTLWKPHALAVVQFAKVRGDQQGRRCRRVGAVEAQLQSETKTPPLEMLRVCLQIGEAGSIYTGGCACGQPRLYPVRRERTWKVSLALIMRQEHMSNRCNTRLACQVRPDIIQNAGNTSWY